MSCFRFKNINVYYGSIHAIKDVSFHVDEGEIVTLIGANGAGKTTTMHAISGLLKLASGEITYDGNLISKMEAHKIVRLGLAQVPEGRRVFSGLTVQQNLSMGAYTRHDGKDAIQSDYDRVFDLLPRLKERRNQPAGTLSGGEQQMLAVGRALMCKPKILLLDEPSNDLDLETLRWLEQYIRSCTVPVLYISHDEMLLERTANRILHMEQICRKTRARYFVTRMGYREYVQNRQEQFQRQEQQARKERMEYDRQQERYRQIYQKVERRQSTISRGKPYEAQRLKQKMHTVKAMGHRMEREKREMTEFPEQEESIFLKFPRETALPAGKKVLDLQLPVLEVPDRKLAENLRLQIRGPEKICIIGKNGRGKTTLLKNDPGPAGGAGNPYSGGICRRIIWRRWTRKAPRWISWLRRETESRGNGSPHIWEA